MNCVAEFLYKEAGEPINWGESIFEGLPFSPNPSANLVSAVRGVILC